MVKCHLDGKHYAVKAINKYHIRKEKNGIVKNT